MTIEQTDIAKLARLARIHIADGEAAELRDRLDAILHMVDAMQAVDTEGVVAMANPNDAVQRLRADIVSEGNAREQLQANAPLTEDGLFLVPKVIE